MDMTRTRRAFAVTLAAATASVAIGLPARADGGPHTTAALCAFGYVCIQPATGSTPVRVPQGSSRQFPGGLKATSITNLTTLTYCVTGSLNFALASGATRNQQLTVNSVAPLPGAGGACLA